MSALQNLSQLQFPGMPEPEPARPREASPQAAASPVTYPDNGAWSRKMWSDDPDADLPLAPNPIPRTGLDHARYANDTTYVRGQFDRDEFIPPFQVTTDQDIINPEAVEHQVRHADPLNLDKDPSVYYYETEGGEPRYDIADGNHRVNAALRRGQLFMPAKVHYR